MKRLCGSRLRNQLGRRCRKVAAAGKLRCYLHGGTARHGRHLTEDAHHSVSLSKARAARGPLYPLDHAAGGRARARRATRDASGRYLPGGRPPPHKYIDQAQRVVERVLEMTKKSVPALPSEAAALQAKPWGAMTAGEKLAANSETALDVCREILSLAIDPNNVRLLAQIKDCALSIIATRARIDEVGAKWASRAAEEAERDRVLSAMVANLQKDPS
jgi:hypothetical protein